MFLIELIIYIFNHSKIKILFMKKLLLLIFVSVLVLSSLDAIGQDKPDSKFGISFSGFVKSDFFYDSRQTQSAREGHFFLFPEKEVLDKNGEDINAKPNFNFLNLQTRITGKITGPDFFDAKTSGLIEGEFFGTSDGDLNGFRLRHAFVKLDWENTSLLAGQFWHPMFVADCSPATISFNTGAPFQPFARNPQIRLTQKAGNISIIAALAMERDFQSPGPNGYSTSYMRNAGIPDANLQFQYKSGDNLFGFGGQFKMIEPRTVTTKNVITSEKLTSYGAMAFGKLKFDDVTFKIEGVYGNNMADLMMLGGYAVKSIDTTTNKETYTPINVFSGWAEISYVKNFELGLFAGYLKNLGTTDNNLGTYYGRATNVDYQFRISPRVGIFSGKTKIAFELETTMAAFGTNDNNDKGKVINTKTVTNVRGLLSFIYSF